MSNSVLTFCKVYSYAKGWPGIDLGASHESCAHPSIYLHFIPWYVGMYLEKISQRCLLTVCKRGLEASAFSSFQVNFLLTKQCIECTACLAILHRYLGIQKERKHYEEAIIYKPPILEQAVLKRSKLKRPVFVKL